MLLTAERLLHYQRCHRRTFLDVYGDRTLKTPPSDFQLKLLQERLAHQQFILAEQVCQGATPHYQPNYPKGDWKAGAQATKALMQQGVERIHKGVLLTTGEAIGSGRAREQGEKVTLISHPDLLIKQPGKSDFGDWLYVPTDIHLGKRAKQEYQIVAAYHTQLLASVQGAWPEKAWLNLRGKKGEYEVDLWRWLPEMQITLEKCMQMLLEQQEPEVFISRQQCSVCPWLTPCYAIAKSQQHLSLLPGVTPSRYQHLQTLRLTTLESLADANPVYLEPELETEVAQHLVQQAQSVLENRVILTPSESFTVASGLPTAPIELYFDIEAEPSLNLDYLLGVLVVDRQANTETFYPLVAEKPADEEAIWLQFLDLVSAYPDAPIFHYSPYEADTVKRLAKLYPTPAEQVKPLLSRFVDLHKQVTDAVTLPLEGYSLKMIANWLGFKWRDPQANGSQSICWYDKWLETGDRTLLNAILRYNEDDCKATHRLKDWLVDFLQCAYQKNI
ncbi:MAG: TM0106 family RecB-like putative nuclease [Aphanothece sp. CMT-3BRIN-NPC111]|jgi:uncharacterized protein|nr:TM0106 family RecB-like putative nuclease [Aphanothece sp. CMT-3BRIN-NPC111]